MLNATQTPLKSIFTKKSQMTLVCVFSVNWPEEETEEILKKYIIVLFIATVFTVVCPHGGGSETLK